MPHFNVPIVRRELLSLWRDFWTSPEPSDEAKKANADGSLGQSIDVQAKSKHEAAKLAESKRPGYVAILNSIERMGG